LAARCKSKIVVANCERTNGNDTETPFGAPHMDDDDDAHVGVAA